MGRLRGGFGNGYRRATPHIPPEFYEKRQADIAKAKEMQERYADNKPQLAWGVKQETIATRDAHSWYQCTRCKTVHAVDIPSYLRDTTAEGFSKTSPRENWKRDNIKCPRCKAFYSHLAECTPAMLDEVIEERRRNPPPPPRPRTERPAYTGDIYGAPANPFKGKHYIYGYGIPGEIGFKITGQSRCADRHPMQDKPAGAVLIFITELSADEAKALDRLWQDATAS